MWHTTEWQKEDLLEREKKRENIRGMKAEKAYNRWSTGGKPAKLIRPSV
jgi:hypothetical protein